ncbi:hypothetical protein HY251_02850 [bacterium]|nr:hypothetical protein [bacterium]
MKLGSVALLGFGIFGAGLLANGQDKKDDAAKTEWKEFKCEEGRFKVQYPGTPKETTQKIKTAVGEVTLHTFMLEMPDGTAYATMYSDYPEESMTGKDPEALLDGARDGLTKNVKGTILKETKIKIGGNPGREFVVVNGQITILARVCAVKNRLYQALEGLPLPKSKLLSSFELIESEKK